jgi:hypothetical protein
LFGRLIILLGVVIGVLYFLHWFRKTPPEKVSRILKKTVLYGLIVAVVMLAVTGRLPWLFAVIGAAIPVVLRGVSLLRNAVLIRQLFASLGLSGAAPAAGGRGGRQNSSIRTRFFEMVLEHATGAMDGTVLEGPRQGKRLSDLPLDELLELLAVCRREDGQSAAVLEAYLDRGYSDWREQAGVGDAGQDTRSASMGTGEMTRNEAYAVLGLQAGASKEEIRDAHRHLMQKLHPDRGGSTYLAAKINQAKDLLLETEGGQ